MSNAKFSSPQVRYLFEAFTEAAACFDDLTVLEATTALLTETIASGNFSAGATRPDSAGAHWLTMVAHRKRLQ